LDEPAETRRPRHVGYAAQVAEGIRVSRPALVALGVLLIVGCATAGAVLAGRSNHDRPYLVALRPIPPGTVISASDLGVVSLDPPATLAAVPAAGESSVLGRQAQYQIPAGSLLDAGELTAGEPLPAGEAIVGASLASNQLPDELAPGDQVLVVYTSSTGGSLGGLGTPVGPPNASPSTSPGGTPGTAATETPGGGGAATGARQAAGASGQTATGQVQPDGPAPGAVLTSAQVLEVVQPGSAASAGVATGSLVIVSLVVPARAAALVTAASAANDISLAVVPSARPSSVSPRRGVAPTAPKAGRTR
jgi:hypothetical protein